MKVVFAHKTRHPQLSRLVTEAEEIFLFLVLKAEEKIGKSLGTFFL